MQMRCIRSCLGAREKESALGGEGERKRKPSLDACDRLALCSVFVLGCRLGVRTGCPCPEGESQWRPEGLVRLTAEAEARARSRATIQTVLSRSPELA